jgi:tetratricopeptide (TPR) repeat protein
MINLALTLLATLGSFLLLWLTHLLKPLHAILPVILIGGLTWFLLVRRTGKLLEATVLRAHELAKANKLDAAVDLLRSAFPLGRWQFLVDAQLHGQVGQLLYIQKKYDDAEPHLAKAWVKHWPARAMLGAQHFRRKEWAEMEKVFDAALRSNKEEALLYAVYAWCQDKRGERKKSIEVLQRGVAQVKGDEKLKALLQRAQNDKRLKMDAFEPAWWQFGLEAPKVPVQGGFGGGGFGVRGTFGRGRR